MKLKIADSLALPIDAATEKLAFLGRTGSGKTYAAQKLAEEMYAADVQFIALDPVGKWWSLRLAANGKDPGIPLPVFGGLQGDVPLEPTAGALIADVIVDRGISAVVDVSQFESDADKARFMTDFGARFYFRKKSMPSAVHLFIEEAQEFVPQHPQKDETRMLHVWTRIQKLGRNFGIGTSLLSQRPQEVNKKVLNQTELLFVFQLTGPQERKTIAGWIEEKGIDEDIVGELPKLVQGRPHVWSPAWLQMSKVVAIGEKWTFDASSTPRVGKRAAVRELAPIDIEQLGESIKASRERAKADDPKELRKQIVELTTTRNALLRQLQKPSASQTQRFVEVLTDSDRARLGRLHDAIAQAVKDLGEVGQARLDEFVQTYTKEIRKQIDALTHAFEASGLKRAIDKVNAIQVAPASTPSAPVEDEYGVPPLLELRDRPKTRARKAAAEPTTNGAITGPEQKILDALGWFESIGITKPAQPAVAMLAGYTAKSSAYRNPRSRLSSAGLARYDDGALVLTAAGRAQALVPETPLSPGLMHARILSILGGPERAILTQLLRAWPDAVSNEDLAEGAGYPASSSAYRNPRSRLSGFGLIEYTAGGPRAKDFLFPGRGLRNG